MHAVITIPPQKIDTLEASPLSEEQPLHRVIFHVEDSERARVYYPKVTAEDSFDQLSQKLDRLVDFEFATGGHVETFINDEIGWVVSKDHEVS